MSAPADDLRASPPDGALPCDVEELRTLFLFEALDDDQLRWLCRHGHVEHREPGPLYAEGEPARWFYVLLEGTVAMSRRVGRRGRFASRALSAVSKGRSAEKLTSSSGLPAMARTAAPMADLNVAVLSGLFDLRGG